MAQIRSPEIFFETMWRYSGADWSGSVSRIKIIRLFNLSKLAKPTFACSVAGLSWCVIKSHRAPWFGWASPIMVVIQIYLRIPLCKIYNIISHFNVWNRMFWIECFPVVVHLVSWAQMRWLFPILMKIDILLPSSWRKHRNGIIKLL